MIFILNMIKNTFKNVIYMYTVKSIMWMSSYVHVHEPTPLLTLHWWEYYLALLASYLMFGLLKCEFWYSREWYLRFLAMASCCSGGCSCKIIFDGMVIREWTILGLYTITIFVLLLFHWQIISSSKTSW